MNKFGLAVLLFFAAVLAPLTCLAAFRFVDVLRNAPPAVDGLDGAISLTVSPDGKHLYAAGRNADAVAVFSRDDSTGVLSFVEVLRDGVNGVDGLDGASGVTVSPDGRHVYVGGTYDLAVAVFSRDALTGALTFVEMQQDGVGGVEGLLGVLAVTVSPDGKHVYAASLNDDAVAVFSRDAGTGVLRFVEMQQDGVGGVDGLDSATSVVVSPDGAHVLVAAALDAAVAVFSRDSSTGMLSFVEMQQDGVGGVDGLLGASSVAISADGKTVYVAGKDDDAVSIFSRDAGTGVLIYVGMQKDGVGGVDGLDSARSVAVSPDGSQVFVAGYQDDAVAVFSRDLATGALSFKEAQKDGVGGVDGLDGVFSVTVSPDGKHVYSAGFVDDAVAVFFCTRPTFAPLYLLLPGAD